ncbi:hypothetical protein Cphy_1606 [Lachnoclostridium phytofermentans ISDg]|uniref:Uncharacterized protein n=1 Tax=Lachnoclostridium phytofermentans (strain ATCC 700394 / DSM 18823 / ISDg) TaxID=357809 RepID=A9KQR7_LACP7|nr:hypothetical protein Cphy_1606 [Lachnoclostridium phytofermentans ISDg]
MVLLQVFLSKRKNKWLGLILPLLCMSFSAVAFLNGIIFNQVRAMSTNATVLDTILQWLLPLFIMNIPTIVSLAIYFACREQFKKNNELEKMNIQDLE